MKVTIMSIVSDYNRAIGSIENGKFTPLMNGKCKRYGKDNIKKYWNRLSMLANNAIVVCDDSMYVMLNSNINPIDRSQMHIVVIDRLINNKPYPDDILVYNELSSAIGIAAMMDKDVLIIGGHKNIYEGLKYATDIIMCRVMHSYMGDVPFPELDNSWNINEKSAVLTSRMGIVYQYWTYSKQTEEKKIDQLKS